MIQITWIVLLFMLNVLSAKKVNSNNNRQMNLSKMQNTYKMKSSKRSDTISRTSMISLKGRVRKRSPKDEDPTHAPTASPTSTRINPQFDLLSPTEKYITISSIFWGPLVIFLVYWYWEKYFRKRTWLVFSAQAVFPAQNERAPTEVILNYRFGNRENSEYRIAFAEDMIVSEVIMAFDGRKRDVDERVAEVLGQEDYSFSTREVVLYGLAYIPPEDRPEEEEQHSEGGASLHATRVPSIPPPFGI